MLDLTKVQRRKEYRRYTPRSSPPKFDLTISCLTQILSSLLISCLWDKPISNSFQKCFLKYGRMDNKWFRLNYCFLYISYFLIILELVYSMISKTVNDGSCTHNSGFLRILTSFDQTPLFVSGRARIQI